MRCENRVDVQGTDLIVQSILWRLEFWIRGGKNVGRWRKGDAKYSIRDERIFEVRGVGVGSRAAFLRRHRIVSSAQGVSTTCDPYIRLFSLENIRAWALNR